MRANNQFMPNFANFHLSCAWTISSIITKFPSRYPNALQAYLGIKSIQSSKLQISQFPFPETCTREEKKKDSTIVVILGWISQQWRL